jgi:hypothetical protein
MAPCARNDNLRLDILHSSNPERGRVDFVIFNGLSVCLEELEKHPTTADSARGEFLEMRWLGVIGAPNG